MYYPITTSKALIRPATYNFSSFLEAPTMCQAYINIFDLHILVR